MELVTSQNLGFVTPCKLIEKEINFVFFFSDVGDGIINNNHVIWKGTDIRDLDRSTSYICSIYHGTGYVGIRFDQRTIPRV